MEQLQRNRAWAGHRRRESWHVDVAGSGQRHWRALDGYVGELDADTTTLRRWRRWFAASLRFPGSCVTAPSIIIVPCLHA